VVQIEVTARAVTMMRQGPSDQVLAVPSFELEDINSFNGVCWRRRCEILRF